MHTRSNIANSQFPRKIVYPTHLTPAQRMAMVLKVNRPSAFNTPISPSKEYGASKAAQMSRAAI